MANILVIGGSGFLGSHIADELTDIGHKVTIFDREKSLYLKKNQKMIVGDMLDKKEVMKACKNKDILYHFGATADIDESSKQPFLTINNNIMGTVLAIEAAIKNKIKRFVYSSTLYVHNDKGSFYGTSKIACENLLHDYHNKFNFNYTILRYGSLYGPRAQTWNSINKLITQAIKKGKIEKHGTGEERREYIHVKDAAKISADILDNKYKNKTLTITGNQILDAKQLTKMIFEIAGKKEKIIFSGKPSLDDHYFLTPYKHKVDFNYAKKITSNECIDLGEGLLELISEKMEELDNIKS